MSQDDEEYIEAVAALAVRCPTAGTFWKHKNGTVYVVETGCLIEATLTPAVMYYKAGTDPPFRVYWVRPLSEFKDGRFVRTDNPH